MRAVYAWFVERLRPLIGPFTNQHAHVFRIQEMRKYGAIKYVPNEWTPAEVERLRFEFFPESRKIEEKPRQETGKEILSLSHS
jgi:hypothetical protein